MPETGNKLPVAADIVSIRPAPDGHCFSCDSAKVVLVPREEYSPGAGESLLSFGGMAPAADETVVVSGVYDGGESESREPREPSEGVVAVMAIRKDEWRAVTDAVASGASAGAGSAGGSGAAGSGDSGSAGEQFVVTSPLLELAVGKKRGRRVEIVTTARNCYIAVWDRGLRMAEALPDNSADSILYYMQVVGQRFKLRKFDIRVAGEKAEIAVDALRKCYKNAKIR
jgi:hypothetical protein